MHFLSPINAGSMEEKEEGRGKSNTRQTGMEEEEEEGKKRKCIGSGGKKNEEGRRSRKRCFLVTKRCQIYHQCCVVYYFPFTHLQKCENVFSYIFSRIKCGKKALIQIRSIAPGDQTAIGASACNNNVPTAQQKGKFFCVSNFQNGRESCICSFKFSTLVFFSLPPPFLLPYLLPIISYPLGDPIRATDHRTNELCMGAGTDRVTVTN